MYTGNCDRDSRPARSRPCATRVCQITRNRSPIVLLSNSTHAIDWYFVKWLVTYLFNSMRIKLKNFFLWKRYSRSKFYLKFTSCFLVYWLPSALLFRFLAKNGRFTCCTDNFNMDSFEERSVQFNSVTSYYLCIFFYFSLLIVVLLQLWSVFIIDTPPRRCHLQFHSIINCDFKWVGKWFRNVNLSRNFIKSFIKYPSRESKYFRQSCWVVFMDSYLWSNLNKTPS